MDNREIQSILQNIGKRVPPSSHLVLVGGSALTLLGSSRQTVDIDFVGDDVHPSNLHQSIMQLAKELKINLEPVPIERFIPLPTGSEE
ncbi:MAG TPA: nucleotidyl transferase AbiEii/AbiGii toxin family protein [Anaerolineales bacterium]|nr:nucleotidyl transferase AbiEii/AbiGii toxin family protein [Anaerolineales bacterium]